MCWHSKAFVAFRMSPCWTKSSKRKTSPTCFFADLLRMSALARTLSIPSHNVHIIYKYTGWSAFHALESGYRTVIVEDASRGIFSQVFNIVSSSSHLHFVLMMSSSTPGSGGYKKKSERAAWVCRLCCRGCHQYHCHLCFLDDSPTHECEGENTQGDLLASLGALYALLVIAWRTNKQTNQQQSSYHLLYNG